MNYYEVLPLKKTGTENQVFTYESIEKIKVGSLVSVPLKNRVVRGLVTKKVQKPKFKTRAIEKKQTPEPVLNENQIMLAQKISDYYLCSLGETINAFLPFMLGKKRRKISSKNTPPTKRALKEKTINPNEYQTKIISEIEASRPSSKHLIHGVTGSGKTEIYLKLVERALSENDGSIVLVPEISLTPQTMSRFESRFPNKVSVWHSQLKETEKYQTWEEIRNGEKRIILGARSAIFMPINNLKYIIVDEEHETSYKQDKNPKYETQKVAEWLAELTGAKLVLGTATPRVETFYKSQNNNYKLHEMNNRIVQKSMPPVDVIDMREEFRKGNKSIFSDLLLDSIQKTLNEKKQVVLFVNRRGSSTFVVCRDCGYVEKCPNCDIPLTHHLYQKKTNITTQDQDGSSIYEQKLSCHHCNFKKRITLKCPLCNSYAFKYFGLGTQKVEIEAKNFFPKAKILRADQDSTKKRGSHELIYNDFKNKNFDILVGTQMIAKGWDLPNINLVGVIAADTTLNLPDFRSAEKTFSLLTQVAGRTGRGFHPGKVVIQTYSPENYVVKHAQKHDYKGFYEEEIISRKKYGYPPFSNFIKLSFRHKDEGVAIKKSEELKNILENNIKTEGVVIIGPVRSFIYRRLGYYNWQIIIKINQKSERANKEDKDIIDINQKIKEIATRGWSVDINPENLL